MAATKARRRRPKTNTHAVGKEAWQVIGPDGAVVRETGWGAEVALVLAQSMAMHSKDETTLTVQLKPLFGEPDLFYRVVKDEDGAVSTYRQ